MRARDFIVEGKNHPTIVVDVQPAYAEMFPSECEDIIEFVNNQKGPVLMFVNSDEEGYTDDSVDSIREYWEDAGFNPKNWSRVTLVDKGYGYFRAWMDHGVEPDIIIKVIRKMYQEKVNDSRMLFQGADDYDAAMEEFTGVDDFDFEDPLSVEWTSISQLKEFNKAYLVGGGREECLREVELLMNAFNIKYKRIDSLVYG